MLEKPIVKPSISANKKPNWKLAWFDSVLNTEFKI